MFWMGFLDPETAFGRSWTAVRLAQPPLILPARQFVYPQAVPGEEDALARGAMLLEVRPVRGGTFLATCALGFRDPNVPSGVFSCPRAEDLLAVAGGYAYLVDTLAPERVRFLEPRPVVRVLAAEGLLLLVGLHTVAAVGAEGPLWETGRLSFEGVTVTGVDGGRLLGTGWHMMTDKEIPFAVDLRTGEHTGGAGWV